MKLHLLAAGFSMVTYLLMDIPSILRVGFGVVLADAGIFALLTLFASLGLAKWGSRLHGAFGAILLVISLINIYTFHYSLAYVMGADALMMAETPIRYVLSAILTAVAISSLFSQWWPEGRRA